MDKDSFKQYKTTEEYKALDKNAKRRLWYSVNKEKRKEYNSNYYQNNKDKIDETNRVYRKQNPERVSQWNKSYREKNLLEKSNL